MAENVRYRGPETQIGYISNEHNYDKSRGSPTFNQILLEIILGDMNEFVFIAQGKIGSPSRQFSGLSVLLSRNDVLNAAKEKGSYNQRMQNLLGTNIPFEQVTGVVLRRIR